MNVARCRMYLFAVSLVILLVILVVPAMGAMSSPLNARDLTGTNMEGIDHWNTLVNSAQECADLCDATPGCEGATYVLPNTIQGPNGHCWRKSVVTGDVENFNCISFKKQAALPGGSACWGITPAADFSGFPVSGIAPYAVQFTDTSAGAQSWSWDFGDGTTSAQKDPLHVYTTGNPEGIPYTVTLAVTGTCAGQADSVTKAGYITVYDNVGALDLSSVPAGANIYLGSRNLGTTPFKNFVPAGIHQLRLTLSGYRDYESTVTIIKGQKTQVSATMEPVAPATPPSTGSIQVTTIPGSAALSVDGVPQGVSPQTVSGLAAGSHTVLLTKAGYSDYQGTVSVAAGMTTLLDVTLVAGSGPSPAMPVTPGQPAGNGSLTVTSSPPGANVDLDGYPKGTTPLTVMQVTGGPHTLMLTKTGYRDSVQVVTVAAEQDSAVAVNLTAVSQGPPEAGYGTSSPMTELTRGPDGETGADLSGGKKIPGFSCAAAVLATALLVTGVRRFTGK